jgi:hypothetical protein
MLDHYLCRQNTKLLVALPVILVAHDGEAGLCQPCISRAHRSQRGSVGLAVSSTMIGMSAAGARKKELSQWNRFQPKASVTH